VTPRSSSGVEYKLNTDDNEAIAVTEDFLVAGPEETLRQTLALLGDESKSLAEADRYKDGVGDLGDDRLGHFYLDFGQLVKTGFEGDPNAAEQLQQFQQIFPLEKVGPLMGSFSANGERLAVDASIDFGGDRALGALGALSTGGSTPLMTELPGDAWGAFGSPKYGQYLKASLDQFAGAFGGMALRNELQRSYGIDLDDDILSWIGDVAVFVRGDSLATIDGGLVIQVTDEDKAANGFGKLAGLVQAEANVRVDPVKVEGAETAFAIHTPNIPELIVFARGEGKVVVAYGMKAAAAALSPSSTLGDSDLYDRAKDTLGDFDPGFLLSVPSAVALIDSADETDPGWEAAKPYLEAYDVVAMGGEGSGGRAKIRVAAGLK
jgi:uncharacterized protein DUF3352